jgi:hypothetical protein
MADAFFYTVMTVGWLHPDVNLAGGRPWRNTLLVIDRRTGIGYEAQRL